MLTFAVDAQDRGGRRMKSGLLLLLGAPFAALVFALLFLKGAPSPAPPAGGGAAAGDGLHTGAPTELRPPLSLPSGEGAWMLVSTVGGGFDGKGKGVVAANSSGEVVAAPPSSPPGARFSCKSRLAEEGLQSLARVVSDARGREWAAAYVDPKNPGHCCDQFGYMLELHVRAAGGGEQVYAASWYDSSAYLIPKDLFALQEAVERLRAKVFEGCEGAQSISRQKTATATMAAGEE